MKSSVRRATETSTGSESARHKRHHPQAYFVGIPVGGRPNFLACQVSLGPLQPTEPGFNSPHVQLLTSALL
jgi:hypothetical protein